MILRLPVLLSLAILGACASSGPQAPVTTSSPAVVRETAPAATSAPIITSPEPIRVEPAPRPSTPEPEPAPQQRPSEPATPSSTLLASVDQAIAAGDLERAAALSERALRISPRDAYLWYRLANIRYVQRQYSEAEGFARRALSFAGNDRDLTQQINQLLTQVSAAN
jgi:tetratricopeptide (TPR) repeat protein